MAVNLELDDHSMSQGRNSVSCLVDDTMNLVKELNNTILLHVDSMSTER